MSNGRTRSHSLLRDSSNHGNNANQQAQSWVRRSSRPRKSIRNNLADVSADQGANVMTGAEAEDVRGASVPRHPTGEAQRLETNDTSEPAPHAQAQAQPIQPPKPAEPRLPRLPKLFKKRMTYDQIRAAAAQKYPFKVKEDQLPPIPDEPLFSHKEVEDLPEERAQLGSADAPFEICEQCTHYQYAANYREAEVDVLMRKLNFEKAKNASLAGELARFQGLAGRVLHGNGPQGSWDSQHDAFIQLIGELLRWRKEEEDEEDEVVWLGRKEMKQKFGSKQPSRKAKNPVIVIDKSATWD